MSMGYTPIDHHDICSVRYDDGNRFFPLFYKKKKKAK